MAMKKIKPKYGKVVPPAVIVADEKKEEETATRAAKPATGQKKQPNKEQTAAANQSKPAISIATEQSSSAISAITAEPNPFLQSKEIFSQANLTKIGYRMRSEYVEILDILKKLKKGGYTLEAVLDDALTYYFENSEDGKDAIKKAEIFYS